MRDVAAACSRLTAAVAWQCAGCCRFWVHGLTVDWVEQREMPSGCTCGAVGRSRLANLGELSCCMQRRACAGSPRFMQPGSTCSILVNRSRVVMCTSKHVSCRSLCHVSKKSVVLSAAGEVQKYLYAGDVHTMMAGHS